MQKSFSLRLVLQMEESTFPVGLLHWVGHAHRVWLHVMPVHVVHVLGQTQRPFTRVQVCSWAPVLVVRHRQSPWLQSGHE